GAERARDGPRARRADRARLGPASGRDAAGARRRCIGGALDGREHHGGAREERGADRRCPRSARAWRRRRGMGDGRPHRALRPARERRVRGGARPRARRRSRAAPRGLAPPGRRVQPPRRAGADGRGHHEARGRAARARWLDLLRAGATRYFPNHSRSGFTTAPALTSPSRTAATIFSAPVLSPWMQIVSIFASITLPVIVRTLCSMTMRTAWSAAFAGSETSASLPSLRDTS